MGTMIKRELCVDFSACAHKVPAAQTCRGAPDTGKAHLAHQFAVKQASHRLLAGETARSTLQIDNQVIDFDIIIRGCGIGLVDRALDFDLVRS